MKTILKGNTFLKSLLIATLVSGTLDAIAGVIVYFIYFKLNPIEVLQFIASGVYGPSAIGGGLFMILAGTFFHFLIAFVCSLIFIALSSKLKGLLTYYRISGLLFGLGIWIVMNILVLPFSNIPKSPFDLSLAIVGIIWHMVLVGLPISIISKEHYS